MTLSRCCWFPNAKGNAHMQQHHQARQRIQPHLHVSNLTEPCRRASHCKHIGARVRSGISCGLEMFCETRGWSSVYFKTRKESVGLVYNRIIIVIVFGVCMVAAATGLIAHSLDEGCDDTVLVHGLRSAVQGIDLIPAQKE